VVCTIQKWCGNDWRWSQAWASIFCSWRGTHCESERTNTRRTLCLLIACEYIWRCSVGNVLCVIQIKEGRIRKLTPAHCFHWNTIFFSLIPEHVGHMNSHFHFLIIVEYTICCCDASGSQISSATWHSVLSVLDQPVQSPSWMSDYLRILYTIFWHAALSLHHNLTCLSIGGEFSLPSLALVNFHAEWQLTASFTICCIKRLLHLLLLTT
jgi:hypothetical protein